MSDIFISYANEDRDTAARFARLLESVGWRVWWDRRIPAGRTWRSILEEALREMRCLVVLWSKNSVQSSWVTEEAEEARRLGKVIVPVLIERVEPPIGFRAIQAADLADWNGSTDDPAAQLFIADLRSVLGEPIEKLTPESDLPQQQDRKIDRLAQRVGGHRFKIVAVAAAVVALLGGWRIWEHFKEETATSAPEPKTVQPSAPRLTGLIIRGERKELKPAEKVRLELSGTYSDGKQALVKDGINWSSSASQVASINDDGEITGLKDGTAEIRANVGEVASAPWTITIKGVELARQPALPPKLVALRVSVESRELFIKERLTIRVRGRYSDNTEQTLTSGIEWQISDRAVASITSIGELQALRPGKVEVIARSGDLSSAPVRLVVKEPQSPVPPVVKPAQIPDAGPTKMPPPIDQAKAKITAYVDRAESLREQGNYAAALAELEKARTLDPSNENVRKEIEQTKRACNAERVLGSQVSC
jgi:hypothetical protein